MRIVKIIRTGVFVERSGDPGDVGGSFISFEELAEALRKMAGLLLRKGEVAGVHVRAGADEVERFQEIMKWRDIDDTPTPPVRE